MTPNHKRFLIFVALLVIASIGILRNDLVLRFINNSLPFSTNLNKSSGILSIFHGLQKSRMDFKNASVDNCFDTFMQLLRGQNISRNLFFIEPNPPIPVSTVSDPCRKYLIPKPVNDSRLKELTRCYLTSNFITYKTIDRVLRGLRIVKKIFDDNKVPLILCGGSLVGSYRYHGHIPYDDDFDFYIPAENRSFIEKQLSNLCKRDPTFNCSHMDSFPHLQLLIGVKNQTKDKYPYASFIDFFSYSKSNALKSTTTESIMFPLIKRPFEGGLYDSINNYPTYYKRWYGKPSANIHVCHSHDHSGNARVKGCKPVKCDELNSFLPFVVASETSVGRLEIGVNASHIRSLFFHRKSHGVFLYTRP